MNHLLRILLTVFIVSRSFSTIENQKKKIIHKPVLKTSNNLIDYVLIQMCPKYVLNLLPCYTLL